MQHVTDGCLENLYRMKREALVEIAAAEERLDLITMRAFQEHLTKLNGLIQRKGGSSE